MDTREIILNVENLNTTFISDKKKIHIVKDVSFQVKRGKTLAVVGESGCGKSVTMNSVMRFLGRNAIVEAKSIQYNALKNGEVKEYHLEQVKNKDINGSMMRELRGPDMAMVFQDPMSSLNPVYKVGNQVAEGFLQHNRGMTKKQAREKVLEMFRKLGIPDPEERIDCYPHQFSGGMKQRVVIAMALACNPMLLIADEPTTALDVTIQAQVLEMMKGLRDKYNTSMLMITHDLGIVANIAKKIIVMYAGKVVETGTDDKWGPVVAIEDASGRIWRVCGTTDAKVKKGDTVSAGQIIGKVGSVSCECAEESHIHLEVMEGEKYLDPIKAMK